MPVVNYILHKVNKKDQVYHLKCSASALPQSTDFRFLVYSWAFGRGWPWTPQSFTRARHALPFFALSGRVACGHVLPFGTPHTVRLWVYHHLFLGIGPKGPMSYLPPGILTRELVPFVCMFSGPLSHSECRSTSLPVKLPIRPHPFRTSSEMGCQGNN
jgi:hypothetical protein